MYKITIHKLAVTLAAAVIIPALALAQGPAAEDQDGPDGGGGPMAPMGEMMHHGGGEGGGPGMGMGMGMHGGMHHRGGPGMGLGFLINNPEMRQKLGITDEQAAKIRQQTLDFRKAEIRNRADLEIKRLDLHSLMAADAPDKAAIDRTLQEVGASQMALEKSAVDFHLAMRAALTPEQREKLKAMRQESHPGGEGQHRTGGPGGPGGPGGAHSMRRPEGPRTPAPPPPPPQQ
jgi:Spy/CpxP family protein refolding chaperone